MPNEESNCPEMDLGEFNTYFETILGSSPTPLYDHENVRQDSMPWSEDIHGTARQHSGASTRPMYAYDDDEEQDTVDSYLYDQNASQILNPSEVCGSSHEDRDLYHHSAHQLSTAPSDYRPGFFNTIDPTDNPRIESQTGDKDTDTLSPDTLANPPSVNQGARKGKRSYSNRLFEIVESSKSRRLAPGSSVPETTNNSDLIPIVSYTYEKTAKSVCDGSSHNLRKPGGVLVGPQLYAKCSAADCKSTLRIHDLPLTAKQPCKGTELESKTKSKKSKGDSQDSKDAHRLFDDGSNITCLKTECYLRFSSSEAEWLNPEERVLKKEANRRQKSHIRQ